jgi:hypothetical protein
MKIPLLVIAVIAMCVGAFAQGKINVWNDANHAVFFGTDLSPADCALRGTLVTGTPTPSGSVLVADLYGHAGTAGGSLALLTTVSMNAGVPGMFGPVNWNSPLPGGSPSTFQVRIRDIVRGAYGGSSQIFTMQPGASIAYNSLVNPGGTALSTWAPGTTVVPGGFGAIWVGTVGPVCPEPSNIELSGLGLALLLFFHRRK